MEDRTQERRISVMDELRMMAGVFAIQAGRSAAFLSEVDHRMQGSGQKNRATKSKPAFDRSKIKAARKQSQKTRKK